MWIERRSFGLRQAACGLCLLILSIGGVVQAADDGKTFSTGSADPIVDFINERIRIGWDENEVVPSAVADDAEWVRRVYLDIVGHIPPGDAVERFLDDKDPAKRSKLLWIMASRWKAS